MKRNILNYEALYQVDKMGVIYSRARPGTKGGKLRHKVDKDGYRTVTLSKEGKTKTFMVHRLVAIAFIPNPDNKKTVNHKDRNKANNKMPNLEWSTAQEQQDHIIAFNSRISNEEILFNW